MMALILPAILLIGSLALAFCAALTFGVAIDAAKKGDWFLAGLIGCGVAGYIYWAFS